MSKQEIIDKIRKLLALGENPNPHEAQAALSKAYSLMAKHAIEEGDIKASDPIGGFLALAAPTLPLEVDYAGPILVQFFHVRFVVSIRKEDKFKMLFIVGEGYHREVGCYILIYLISMYLMLWLEFATELRLVKTCKDTKLLQEYRKDFYRGLTAGIFERLQKEQEVQQEEGLVLVEDAALDEYLNKLAIPQAKDEPAPGGDTNDVLMYVAGKQYSEDIQFNKGLDAKEPTKQIGAKNGDIR